VDFSFKVNASALTDYECDLYINNTLNNTNMSIQNDTITYKNGIPHVPGSYKWVLMCFDMGSGLNMNLSEVEYYTVATPTCVMLGNTPPCEEVTVEEILAAIVDWANNSFPLYSIIDLINSWANPSGYPPY
jgi:hypothetical protein